MQMPRTIDVACFTQSEHGLLCPAALQSYPEFTRTAFEQASESFRLAATELEKRHGKVILVDSIVRRTSCPLHHTILME